MKPTQDQLAVIKRGAIEIIDEKELIAKLNKAKPLVIKAGFDPTAPDLHLGHTVLINKLKQFQDLGHDVVFLIGDFTASIGDPSGRSATRPPLSDEQIADNVKTYTEQVFKILDPKKTRVVYNSHWLDKLGAKGMVKLAARYTMARMLEREDFTKRFKEGVSISIHEFLYPLLQGYDSVELKADIELGGGDQKFNLLMGRQLQREDGQEPQVVLMMPLLEGTDGVKKMSKSYDNYIAIKDTPANMFGKVLSITDDLMWRYYELLSFREMSEIEKFKNDVTTGALHPKAAKVMLAKEIVARFHGEAAANHAEVEFNQIFAKKELPDEIEEYRVALKSGGVSLVEILAGSKMCESNSDARRLIAQGGVKINQEKVADVKLHFELVGEYIVQAGKRKFKKVILG